MGEKHPKEDRFLGVRAAGIETLESFGVHGLEPNVAIKAGGRRIKDPKGFFLPGLLAPEVLGVLVVIDPDRQEVIPVFEEIRDIESEGVVAPDVLSEILAIEPAIKNIIAALEMG
jgi:hypothetical protein